MYKRLLTKKFCTVSEQSSQKLKDSQKSKKTTEIKKLFEGDNSQIIPKIVRGKHRTIYDLKVGQNVHNFYVKDIVNLQHFNIKAFYLEHNITKSTYIHLDSSDMNNVFSFVVNTPNKDNKGIPLILEKMILCGSQQFPVRDPFKHLSKTKSLNTFSEPETGNGYISFPFSTSNEKDFNNLLQIYTDLIYSSNLAELDFKNEGIRMEFRDHLNEKSELVYKGNTYDELFKANQIPDQIFLKAVQQNLYLNTDNQYHPDLNELKNLEYQKVKNYYQKHITPFSTSFFSYGDLDFTKHLEFLNHTILSEQNTSAIEENQKYIVQSNYDIKQIKKLQYTKEIKLQSPPSFANLEGGGILGKAYLCNDIIAEPDVTVQLNALAYILFETPESPFYYDILYDGIAPGFCPGYGYDMTSRISSFIIGLRDISKDYKEIMEMDKLIEKKLRSLVKEGFSKYLLDMATHSLEISAKKRQEQFGLILLQNCIPYLINRKIDDTYNPLDILKQTNFQQLKNQIKSEKLLENLIQKYFIDNPNQLRVIVQPQTQFIQTILDNESIELSQKKQQFQNEDKQKIIDETKKLEQHLQRIQDVDILPSINPTDIVPLVERFEFNEKKLMRTIPIIYTDQETPGQSYIRIKFDVSDIDQDLYQYLGIFCKIFPSIGSLAVRGGDFETLIDLATSEFGMKEYSYENEKKQIRKVIVLKFNYLDKQQEQAFNLVNDWLGFPNFESLQKLSELLMYFSSETSNDLVENTLDYAIGYSSSFISQADSVNNSLFRTRQICNEQLEIMKTSAVKERLEFLMKKFKKIYKLMMNKNRLSLMVTSSQKNQDKINRRLEMLMSGMSMYNEQFEEKIDLVNLKQNEFKPSYKKIFMPMPITSNFIVESYKTPLLMDKNRPVMHLLGEVMKNCILTPELVERRGAYDAGVYMNYSGTFSFFSFRDVQTLSTYNYFEQAVQFVANNDFSAQDLDDAKVSIFKNLNRDTLPENKGELLFLYGLTDITKKSYRDAILGTSQKEIVDVCNQYLFEPMSKDESQKLIIGQQDLNLEGLLKRGWKIERPVEDISIQQESYQQTTTEYFKLPEII